MMQALSILMLAVATAGARIVDDKAPSLDEIFVAQVGTKCDAPVEE